MEILKSLWDNLDVILGAIFGVIAVASLIVKATPSQTDDEWLAKVRSFFEWIALNAPRTRPPGIYRSSNPPLVDQLAPPPPVPDTKPEPPAAFRQWPTDKRPPGSMGALLFALLLASSLAACGPVLGPPQPLTLDVRQQLAAACSEASGVIMLAADLNRAGKLDQAAVEAVDTLVAVTKRPCGNQDEALPGDVNRVRSATQIAAAEIDHAA